MENENICYDFCIFFLSIVGSRRESFFLGERCVSLCCSWVVARFFFWWRWGGFVYSNLEIFIRVDVRSYRVCLFVWLVRFLWRLWGIVSGRYCWSFWSFVLVCFFVFSLRRLVCFSILFVLSSLDILSFYLVGRRMVSLFRF